MKKTALIVSCLIMFFLGWFANGVVEPNKANAAKTYEYKVVPSWRIQQTNDAKKLEAFLNSYAKDGWKLLGFELTNPRGFVFER